MLQSLKNNVTDYIGITHGDYECDNCNKIGMHWNHINFKTFMTDKSKIKYNKECFSRMIGLLMNKNSNKEQYKKMIYLILSAQ